MNKKSYIASSIMQEYNNKRKAELLQFQKKNCKFCKNKHTNKCEIRRNIDGELNCQFKEM